MTSTFMLCLRIERSFPFYIQAIFYGHSQHSHCISKKRIYAYIFCWPMAFSRNVRIVASFVFGDVIFLVLFHIADGFSAYILLPDFHRSLSRHPISYTSGTWACLPEQHQPLPRHVSRSRYSLWLDNIIRILFVDAVAIFFISSLLFVHDFLDYYLIYRRTYCVKGDIILLFFFSSSSLCSSGRPTKHNKNDRAYAIRVSICISIPWKALRGRAKWSRNETTTNNTRSKQQICRDIAQVILYSVILIIMHVNEVQNCARRTALE